MKDIGKLKHIYTQYKNIDQIDLSSILNDLDIGTINDSQMYEYIYDWIPHDLRDDLEYFNKYELMIYLEARYGLKFRERIIYETYIDKEIEKIID